MLRVLIIDNEEIFVRGLESALSSLPGFNVAPVFLRTDSAPADAVGDFDLLIVGLSHRGWIEMQPLLLTTRARCQRSLALVSDCVRPHMKEILYADFDSLIHRTATVNTLNRAVHSTVRARRYVDEPVGSWLLSEAASRWSAFDLTPRERDIANLLMTDLSVPDLSRHLRLSQNTVKYHITNLYRKLGIRSRRSLRDVGGGLVGEVGNQSEKPPD